MAAEREWVSFPPSCDSLPIVLTESKEEEEEAVKRVTWGYGRHGGDRYNQNTYEILKDTLKYYISKAFIRTGTL